MSRRLLTCGEHAVLVELDGLEEVLALDEAVRAAVAAVKSVEPVEPGEPGEPVGLGEPGAAGTAGEPGEPVEPGAAVPAVGEVGDAAFADVVDVVPAARTLLVVVREGTDVTPVRKALSTLSAGRPASADALRRGGPHVVEILVHYDGPDLAEISGLTGLAPREVVAAHTQTPWRVAFAGFAPGFAYLTGGDSRLQVPRRSEPRTSVPAGSVGLAGEFSAVYPRSSPGGWQLLGHTDAILWDVDRQPPALLRPGSVVRFVDADFVDADNVDAGTPAGIDADGDAASR
jgi:KipI family sensor histidine kinase inhibitor